MHNRHPGIQLGRLRRIRRNRLRLTMKELRINLGPIAPEIGKQLKAQGFEAHPKQVETWEKLRFSSNMLHVHGIITDRQYIKSQMKIFNKIRKVIEQGESS